MKIVEILRLTEMGMSQREIAASSGCGKTTILRMQARFREAEVTHSDAVQMSEGELHAIMYPESGDSRESIPGPDWRAIHEELATHKNLNLQFMWEEYREQRPDGLSYSRFCELYREWREVAGREVSLYRERKAAEIMEVDWMGDTLPCVVDGATGEVYDAHFFVATLGYSHYPYVEAFPDETEPRWIAGNVNALHYYGGAPRMAVPDNCKTAVITPKYYEPVINSAYWEFAQHYGLAIVPARSYKPKDKPVVEYSVGWLETWLLGKLRNRFFFSFQELNNAIRGVLAELSERPFKKREGTRHSEYIKVDKPALRPLPPQKFEIADVKFKKVGDNYHLEYDGFHYSVPYTLHKEEVILRATERMIEILDKQRVRAASHPRRFDTRYGRYVTDESHMPPNHRAVHQARQFDGRRYRDWARKIGENTYFIIDALLSSGKVEEQGYRASMGLLQLTKKHGEASLEAACRRARELGSPTYTTVSNILKNGLLKHATAATSRPTPDHENIRGGGYYS